MVNYYQKKFGYIYIYSFALAYLKKTLYLCLKNRIYITNNIKFTNQLNL